MDFVVVLFLMCVCVCVYFPFLFLKNKYTSEYSYSMLQATVSVTFWYILARIHIPVQEVQLKSKGKKIQDFLIDTLSIFTLRN